jgi:hypothetical protein
MSGALRNSITASMGRSELGGGGARRAPWPWLPQASSARAAGRVEPRCEREVRHDRDILAVSSRMRR